MFILYWKTETNPIESTSNYNTLNEALIAEELKAIEIVNEIWFELWLKFGDEVINWTRKS